MALDSTMRNDDRIDMGAVLALVWRRKWRILLVTLLLLGLTFAVLMFVPRMYESSASILVEERENAFTRSPTGSGSSSVNVGDPTVMSSEMELIKSRDTLLKVIDSENLRAVPEFTAPPASPLSMLLGLIGRGAGASSGNADETIIQNLNDRLTVVRERDSTVISIDMRTRDPALSARLANAIANAHVARRVELAVSDTAEATAWLQAEIDKLRIGVKEAEDAVAAFRVENDLFDSGSDSLLDQQLANLATQIAAAQERRNTAESRANLIRSLVQSGQPIESLPNIQDSVAVQRLTESKASLEGERAQALATLLPNHPTIRAFDAQIAQLEAQAGVEARRVADGLDAEARVQAEVEASLREEMTRTKLAASNATRDGVELAALEREAAAQRGLLETYLARYRDAASRTDSQSALPDVRVITLAAPSVSPVSPQTALTLAAVALAAIAIQVGGVVFGELVSGRALVPRGEPDEAMRPVTDHAASPAGQALPRYDRPGWPSAEATALPPPTAAEPPAGSPDDYPDMRADGLPDDYPASWRTRRPVLDNPDDRLFDYDQTDLFEDEPDPVVEASPPPLPAAEHRRSETHPVEAAVAADGRSPRPGVRTGKSSPSDESIANLSADVVLGRARVVLLLGLTDKRTAIALSERLVRDAVRRSINIVRIDAATGRRSAEPGLSDLAAEVVGFGEVVHRGAVEGLSEIPWGRRPTLERQSPRPATLVEALTDLYDCVIVNAGESGASALSAFAGVAGRVILVAPPDAAERTVASARAGAAVLGFRDIDVVVFDQQAELA